MATFIALDLLELCLLHFPDFHARLVLDLGRQLVLVELRVLASEAFVHPCSNVEFLFVSDGVDRPAFTLEFEFCCDQ